MFNGTIKELILSLYQAFLFRLPKYQCFYLETVANASICCQNNFIKLLLNIRLKHFLTVSVRHLLIPFGLSHTELLELLCDDFKENFLLYTLL